MNDDVINCSECGSPVPQFLNFETKAVAVGKIY